MGLRSRLFEVPWVYDSFQNAIYRAGQRNRFVVDLINPLPGLRFLDVGCGTADILKHLPDVDYLGIDSNEDYISVARTRFGQRGSFLVSDIRASDLFARGEFDRILLLGVLHHLSDQDCGDLLSRLTPMLRSDGFLVTLDPAYENNQNPISRLISRTDRGRFVRHHEKYRAILGQYFAVETEAVKSDFLRLPSCAAVFRLAPKS